jgi:hypothetical protein
MQIRSSLKSILVLLLALAVLVTTSGTFIPSCSRLEHDSLYRAPLPLAFPHPAQAVTEFDGDHLPDRAELISK